MPQVVKLHKSTGKKKLQAIKDSNLNNPSHSQEPSSSSPVSSLSNEQAEQFEVELCWCIVQLRNALNSGKLTAKQVQSHTNALNTLMNNTVSVIRKRQLMRLSFGDYREKMKLEEDRMKNKGAKFKITSAEPNKKSAFLQKAASSKTGGSSGLRFNFEVSEEDLANSVVSSSLFSGEIETRMEKTSSETDNKNELGSLNNGLTQCNLDENINN